MIVTARCPPVRRLLLAVLVGGLLAGLVGMHHLASGEVGPAESVATGHAHDGDPEPTTDAGPHGDGHGDDGATLLHLCLAVLGAVATLALASVVLWWRPAPWVAPIAVRTRRVHTTSRAPPRPVPFRLALLCVLRT